MSICWPEPKLWLVAGRSLLGSVPCRLTFCTWFGLRSETTSVCSLRSLWIEGHPNSCSSLFTQKSVAACVGNSSRPLGTFCGGVLPLRRLKSVWLSFGTLPETCNLFGPCSSWSLTLFALERGSEFCGARPTVALSQVGCCLSFWQGHPGQSRVAFYWSRPLSVEIFKIQINWVSRPFKDASESVATSKCFFIDCTELLND